MFVNHRGRRKAKQCGPKKLANKVAEIMEANLKLGRPLLGEEEKPPAPTLNQYYERFKERHMKTVIKESSYIVYESAFRLHILPELGRLRLDQIGRERMEDFIVVLLSSSITGTWPATTGRAWPGTARPCPDTRP